MTSSAADWPDLVPYSKLSERQQEILQDRPYLREWRRVAGQEAY